MSNDFFLMHLAKEELQETLYFATGQLPVKTKTGKTVTLEANEYRVVIESPRKIHVNGHRAKSIMEAKWVIQEMLE